MMSLLFRGSNSSVFPTTISIRYASNLPQTIASKDSRGRRLGLKISENQPVRPGLILCRQRGTKFHPGSNVGMARDYTLYSKVYGTMKVTHEPRPPSKYTVFSKGERQFVRKYVNVIADKRIFLFDLERVLTSPISN